MKTVLFVCFHNSGRSQIAEAMVNQWAQERNLSVRAISAGTVCGKVINPTVIEAMNEIGISLTGQQPKQIMPWHVEQCTEDNHYALWRGPRKLPAPLSRSG